MKKILLIDDDVFVRGLLAEGLVHYNLQIVEANNGKEALCVLAEYKVDAIILDIAMPTMNGFDFAQETSKLFPMIPVLVHSALANKDSVLRMHRYGVQAFFAKPARITDIYAKLIEIHKGNYKVIPLDKIIADEFKFFDF
ncbi:MAG: response regulator [Candidatus Cloacimonetes bacterium]|nr:response regulator [Candidatus Cloacimonadota bacterium]